MAIYLIDTIKPKNSGEFPLVEDSDQLGGYRPVADAAARDALPVGKRKAGMLVRTQSDGKFWALGSGLLNSDWTEVLTGGGTSITEGTSPTAALRLYNAPFLAAPRRKASFVSDVSSITDIQWITYGDSWNALHNQLALVGVYGVDLSLVLHDGTTGTPVRLLTESGQIVLLGNYVYVVGSTLIQAYRLQSGWYHDYPCPGTGFGGKAAPIFSKAASSYGETGVVVTSPVDSKIYYLGKAPGNFSDISDITPLTGYATSADYSSICQVDDGSVWTVEGTSAGVLCKYTVVYSEDVYAPVLTKVAVDVGLSLTSPITNMVYDGRYIWFSTTGASSYLHRVNPITLEYASVFLTSDAHPASKVFFDGVSIWVSTSTGAERFNPETMESVLEEAFSASTTGCSITGRSAGLGNEIYVVTSDPSYSVWKSTILIEPAVIPAMAGDVLGDIDSNRVETLTGSSAGSVAVTPSLSWAAPSVMTLEQAPMSSTAQAPSDTYIISQAPADNAGALTGRSGSIHMVIPPSTSVAPSGRFSCCIGSATPLEVLDDRAILEKMQLGRAQGSPEVFSSNTLPYSGITQGTLLLSSYSVSGPGAYVRNAGAWVPLEETRTNQVEFLFHHKVSAITNTNSSSPDILGMRHFPGGSTVKIAAASGRTRTARFRGEGHVKASSRTLTIKLYDKEGITNSGTPTYLTSATQTITALWTNTHTWDVEVTELTSEMGTATFFGVDLGGMFEVHAYVDISDADAETYYSELALVWA